MAGWGWAGRVWLSVWLWLSGCAVFRSRSFRVRTARMFPTGLHHMGVLKKGGHPSSSISILFSWFSWCQVWSSFPKVASKSPKKLTVSSRCECEVRRHIVVFWRGARSARVSPPFFNTPMLHQAPGGTYKTEHIQCNSHSSLLSFPFLSHPILISPWGRNSTLSYDNNEY